MKPQAELCTLYPNFYGFRQKTGRQEILGWMIVSIRQIKSPINVFVNPILICYCHSHVLTRATLTNNLFAVFMSWFCPAFCWWDSSIYSLFSAFIFRPTYVLASVGVSTFYSSRFTSLAQSSSWHVPFNFSQTWFCFTFLMTYSKAKLKGSNDKASPCFRPFWIGSILVKCLSIWIFMGFISTLFNQPNYLHGLFWGCHQSQQLLFPYSPFHVTTCFGLYRPSSGEIYTVVFRSYCAYNRSIFRLYSLLFHIYFHGSMRILYSTTFLTESYVFSKL
jgi:hypothetical protein